MQQNTQIGKLAVKEVKVLEAVGLQMTEDWSETTIDTSTIWKHNIQPENKVLLLIREKGG